MKSSQKPTVYNSLIISKFPPPCAITKTMPHQLKQLFSRTIIKVALLVFIILGNTFILQAQEINMSRYITLTVELEDIKLGLWADSDNTAVKIVSGSQEYNTVINAKWTNVSYKARAKEIIIYGDIKKFVCIWNESSISNIDVSNNIGLSELWCDNNQLSSLDVSNNTELELLSCNGNQLSSLDVSQNTKLTELRCYGNSFTTEAIDGIFCSLPGKDVADSAKIYISNNTSDANHDTVLASNKQNATDKNWKVWYYDDKDGALHNSEPATTGTYKCL